MIGREGKVVTEYGITMTPAEANAFYNDVYRLGRDHPKSFEGARREWPSIFLAWDALSCVGVDGTR